MAAPRRPSFATDTIVMAGRSIRVTVRTPAALVTGLFMPVVLLAVMTASFAKVVAPGGSYADYVNHVLPLFAVMGMTFSAVTTGVAVHRDLHSGLDARFRTLPMSRPAALVGRVAGDVVRNLVIVGVLGAVGAVLGFRVDTAVPAAMAAIAVALAFGTAFAWLAMAMALQAATVESLGASLNGLLLVLSFLSTGLVAASDLPGWAQPIARNSPVSATVEALRALTQGGPTAGPVLEALAWCVGLTAVFAVVALAGLHRSSPE